MKEEFRKYIQKGSYPLGEDSKKYIEKNSLNRPNGIGYQIKTST